MSLRIRACILDLDGVVTRTARVHAAAWKQLFDEYDERREREGKTSFAPFDPDTDYARFVDGRPRGDGVRCFLESRGIGLPAGSPADPPGAETIGGLGNRKNELLLARLESEPPEVFPDAVEALRRWKSHRLRTAVASSSKNCERILEITRLSGLFDARVDGTHLEKWQLPGKPAPDLFLAAARLLGVPPERAAVFEDAIAGVQAARAGGFGLVVGVERFGHPERLARAGADRVVSKLTELETELEAVPPARAASTAGLPPRARYRWRRA
jgi:beta-phosphoglucomutase family hydrolase